MFSRTIILAALALACVSQTLARPMPLPLERALQRKEAAPLDTIHVYERATTNIIPEELPTKAYTANVVQPYANHRRAEINTFPEETAAQSQNGNIGPYGSAQKRAITNNIPAEVATKAYIANVVQPYANRRRAEINTFPEETAAQSQNGNIGPYGSAQKRDFAQVPEQVASRAPQAHVVNRIPSHVATRSLNGVIELYGA